jgi:hypothetical protein
MFGECLKRARRQELRRKRNSCSASIDAWETTPTVERVQQESQWCFFVTGGGLFRTWRLIGNDLGVRTSRGASFAQQKARLRSGRPLEMLPRASLFARFPLWFGMAKLKVSFKPVRNSEGNWSIIAEYPGAEPREIPGFTSKTEIDDWMNGERRISWLRSQGYAK